MDPAKLAADATGLLADVGVRVVLKARRNTEHNAATSDVDGSIRQYEALGFPYNFNLRDIDGVMIMQGDVRVLLSATQTNGQPLPTPQVDDRLFFDGAHWTVLNCSPTKVKGQVVIYEVHARK